MQTCRGHIDLLTVEVSVTVNSLISKLVGDYRH